MKTRFVFAIVTLLSLPLFGATTPLQLRIVDFGDRPHNNTGAPHAVGDQWPDDVVALSSAVGEWSDKTSVAQDIRRVTATPSRISMNDAEVTVVDVSESSARLAVRLEGRDEPVNVIVPLDKTVVLGTDHNDDLHAFLALSLFDADAAAHIAPIYSIREPGVRPPKRVRGTLPPTQSAIQQHMRSTILYFDVDEKGNVVSAVMLGKHGSTPEDIATVEQAARSFRFEPAKYRGVPVRSVGIIPIEYTR